MAAAQGYPDGEAMPLDTVELMVRRIVQTVDLPVTVDFEGAYAVEPEKAAANVARIISAGAIGINFEDGVVGGNGVHDIAFQCRRVEAIRAKAEALDVALFINARTDLIPASRRCSLARRAPGGRDRAGAGVCAGRRVRLLRARPRR